MSGRFNSSYIASLTLYAPVEFSAAAALARRELGSYEFAPFLLELNRPRRFCSHGAFVAVLDAIEAAAWSENSVRLRLTGLSDIETPGSLATVGAACALVGTSWLMTLHFTSQISPTNTNRSYFMA